MSELICENLTHVYSQGTPFEKTAIENVNLTFPQGQMVGIIGHTGSGKSTFIQHLNALLSPSSGRILCDGEDINASKLSRRDIKRKVGLVFQYPEYQLFEETVYKDIAFGPSNMGFGAEEINTRVKEAAGFAGVEEELFYESPLELSGGQKRRIAIAGVIAMRPDVLVLDEPTAGLDPAGCEKILENICRYRRETGATVIIVTHNMDDVARFAERIVVFADGAVAMDGAPEQVFSEPQKLIDLGLDIPKATQIAMELKKAGVLKDDGIYTHSQLVEAVKKAGEVASC